MNGDRTIMVEILNAIEHGTLSVHETRRRLEALIDNEIDKTDAPANLQLINECEKLLWELNTNGSLKFESHLEENKSAVLMRLKRTHQLRSVSKYVIRIGAVAAAIFILVIGADVLLHKEWLNTSTTPDGEQFVISGAPIDPGLVGDVHADENVQNNQFLTTTNLNDATAFLDVDFHFPDNTIENWTLSYYECIKTKRKTRLLAYYTLPSDSEKTMIINATLFPSIEDAYIEFEQNQEGIRLDYQGFNIYHAENIDKKQYMWIDESCVYSIDGHVSLDEAKAIISLILGGQS